MDEISYAEFGLRFVAAVVTADRVRESVARAAGSGGIDAGMKLAGGVVTAVGTGRLAEVTAVQVADNPLAYTTTLHLELSLNIKIAGIPNRFEGTVDVPIPLTVSTTQDLCIHINFGDVHYSQIDVDLKPVSAAAALIEQIGQVSEQVARQVASEVNRRKDSPAAMADRRINLAEAIDAEYERRSSPS